MTKSLSLLDVEVLDISYIHKKAKSDFEALAGHNVLLVGAGGFLGYYFILSILSWNDTHEKKILLTALSSFHAGVPVWLKKLGSRADLKILKKNIARHTISRTQQFYYIIHAASIASPIVYRKFPLETIAANVQGLYSVTRYMISRKITKKPVKGLLYFSSSEVYGNPTPENIPTNEEYNGNVSFTGPRACYDESKRFCETLCSNFVRVHDLPIKIARPFNNYGPGMKISDGRVIADFSRNIINNTDIALFSQGKDTRTFCYVADAIVGYFKILVEGASGEAYNIGIETPEITIGQLSDMMIRIAKKEFGYTGKMDIQKSSDKEYLTDNPQRRCPNISKAKKELRYFPEITLEVGLTHTLRWYKQKGNSI